MNTYELKSWPQLFQAMWDGRKNHDLRRNDDRQFAEGDILYLLEFDPDLQQYTGRRITAEITYITSSAQPCALYHAALNNDYCILSVHVLSRENGPVKMAPLSANNSRNE
jgi:hypothetical protein